MIVTSVILCDTFSPLQFNNTLIGHLAVMQSSVVGAKEKKAQLLPPHFDCRHLYSSADPTKFSQERFIVFTKKVQF